MSLSRIRDEHRVPARPGARVTVNYPGGARHSGTVTGADGDSVLVAYDYNPEWVEAVHPRYITWKG